MGLDQFKEKSHSLVEILFSKDVSLAVKNPQYIPLSEQHQDWQQIFQKNIV
jgi:hypothetical protein